MINAIRKMLGMSPSLSINELLKEGATVVDVRSKGEYAGGHISGSINIPLDQLSSSLHKLKEKDRAIITCCASGMRSASGAAILRRAGYTRVANGGSWISVNNKIKG